MGVCHRISSPRGGGLVTLTVTNPHLAPPMPVWGVVGHNIDRCITMQVWDIRFRAGQQPAHCRLWCMVTSSQTVMVIGVAMKPTMANLHAFHSIAARACG